MRPPRALDLLPKELHGEARGAIPNGTRIVKVFAEPGDANPVGTTGVVLASHAVPQAELATLPAVGGAVSPFVYFVEWDTFLGQPVGVISVKIGLP